MEIEELTQIVNNLENSLSILKKAELSDSDIRRGGEE